MCESWPFRADGVGRTTVVSTTGAQSRGLHRAAKIEDAFHARLEDRLAERGWRPQVTAYTGYGAPGWVRVMARVLMSRPSPARRPDELRRGWHQFVTVPAVGVEVRIVAGGAESVVRTDRGGYIDLRVECDLEPGWQQVSLEAVGPDAGGEVESMDEADDATSGPTGTAQGAVEAPVLVVDPEQEFGLVSDIDDTVMVTSLPRAMLAAWNTFVLNEHARRPVPGMAVLYERLVNAHPGAPVFYLSTGAWNVAPTLTRFLSRHLYPRGPILLTDWGPTKDGWFRSGQAHKRNTLMRLADELPGVRWLLVGDDGQHDPDLYSEFARSHPQNVAAVAIRHLSPTEQVLASGLPVPMDQAKSVPGTPWVSGTDGAALSNRLGSLGLL
jgi:phosphatidate phosphatase APP1